MSQINLNTAHQIPLDVTYPLTPAPTGSTGLLLTAKIVSVLAFFFFVSFLLYVAATRRSMSPSDDSNPYSPGPSASPSSDPNQASEIGKLAQALLEFPLQGDQAATRESLINVEPSSEIKMSMVTFLAQLRCDYPRVEISTDAKKLTDDERNRLSAIERSLKESEYDTALRIDQARAAARKTQEEERKAQQRMEVMSLSYEPLLKGLQDATANLEERSKNLEAADRCYHQCMVENSMQRLTFKDQSEFNRYESRLPDKTREALEVENPSDQFKEGIDGFTAEYIEEAFEGERKTLRNFYEEYCEMIEEVKGRLKWNTLREEILRGFPTAATD